MMVEMPDFRMDNETGELWCKGCDALVPIPFTSEELSWFGTGKLGDPVTRERRLVIKRRLQDTMTAHFKACAKLRSIMEARLGRVQ